MTIYRRYFLPLSGLLDRQLLWLLLSLYALAAVLPEPGVGLRDVTLGELTLFEEEMRVSLPVVLLAALLWNGAVSMPIGELVHLWRRPGPLLAGLSANIAFPLAYTIGIGNLVRFYQRPSDTEAIVVGLALIASMPIAGSASAWTRKANGNLALVLGLVIFSTLLSPVTTPWVLQLINLQLPGQYTLDLQDLARNGTSTLLIFCVLLPSLLGVGTAKILGETRRAALGAVLKPLNTVLLLLLVYINASASLPMMLGEVEGDFVTAMLGVATSFCLVAFATGWLVGRLLRAEQAEQSSLMFALGMSNNGAGMVLASETLAHQPHVLLLVVCYNLVQHVVAGVVDYFRSPELAAEPGQEHFRWRLALQPLLSFTFVVLAGVVLAIACVSYWNIKNLALSHRRLLHAHEELAQIRETLSLLKDAETGERGYLITGELGYLKPYNEAVARVHDRLRRLKALTRDNPTQKANADRVEKLVDNRLDEMKVTTTIRQEQGFVVARRVLLEDHGEIAMNEIRRLMTDMETEEEEMLEERNAEAELRLRRALGTIVLAACLVLAYAVAQHLTFRRRRKNLQLGHVPVGNSKDSTTDRFLSTAQRTRG
jgi:BASS family bile acid:Na+ symporter